MKLIVVFLLITVESTAQVISIAEARKLKSGSVVRVGGRVTVSKEFGDLTFVQDRSGGIPVYSADFATSVERGDSVVVTGKLSKFNSLLEIIPDSARRIITSKREPSPEDISPRQANDHEAELVKLTGIYLRPPGHFFYPQREGLVLKGTDSLHYWIDGDTDLPGYAIPPGPITITGVVSRYRDQFQILPRSPDDIPGLSRTPTAVSKHFLSIMNWNLEFFGATREKYGSEYGPADEEKQVDNVALVLNNIQPDIVALQEVSDDQAFKILINKLPGYEGRCSSRYSYSHDTSEDFPPQKVCYVYKTSVIRLVREKVLFRKLFDDAHGSSNIFSSGRLPYLVEVDVTIDGYSDRMFLVNVHGKSGASPDDHARRLSDTRLLKDTLDHYYASKNLVLLGDFNDDLDVSIAGNRASPYAAFVSDPKYACISKTLSDNNWHSTISYDGVIDHQVVSSPLAEGSTKIVNAFALVDHYAETTSDHLPVISEFDLKKLITGIRGPNDVFVFPNPTSDIVHIICPGNFEYKLINSIGALVGYGTTFDQVSLSVPSAGLYFLQIKKGPISQTLSTSILRN